jgi:energy-converting hydrogenase Eha subunit C
MVVIIACERRRAVLLTRVGNCAILKKMENKIVLIATVRFFAGFCVNVAAAYFLAIFVAQNAGELTTRMVLCILSSYMTISLEMVMQRL